VAVVYGFANKTVHHTPQPSVMHNFARRIASPKGFVLPAEGFSPAALVVLQPTAAGLKPSAIVTKATCVACSQNVHHSQRPVPV
jgi:hypothetical protein